MEFGREGGREALIIPLDDRGAVWFGVLAGSLALGPAGKGLGEGHVPVHRGDGRDSKSQVGEEREFHLGLEVRKW